MVNDLKKSQNNIASSVKLCCDKIKVLDKNYASIESKLDNLISQLAVVIADNKSLRTKLEQLEVNITPIESA